MEAIGQLTGGVAHDFNNLLTIILGGLDMIGRQVPNLESSPPVSRIVRGKDMAIGRCPSRREITSRLLAFARQQPLEPKTVDANKLVAAVTASCCVARLVNPYPWKRCWPAGFGTLLSTQISLRTRWSISR